MGFLDKLASYVAWALAGSLFFTVGWIALEPIDPLGPVSLVTGRGVVGMLIQASLLGIVAALIGTAIIGRKLPDAGTFAAALGLGLVSLRGGTLEFLLLRTADRAESTNRGLAMTLAFETLGWIVAMTVALIASAVVTRWLFGAGFGSTPKQDHDSAEQIPSGWDIPLLGALFGRPAGHEGTSPADGVRHWAIGVAVMLVFHHVFATGANERTLTHGQSCFIVAASVCAGVYLAYRFAPVRSALWPLLSAFAYAFLSFIIAAITTSSEASLPPTVPPSRYLIAVPIQFLGVGSAAAVGSFWWRSAVDTMMRVHAGEDRQRSAWA